MGMTARVLFDFEDCTIVEGKGNRAEDDAER